MAAKKKYASTYDPKVRAKAIERVLARGAGVRGVQASVAKEFGVPQSAVTYWMSAHRAQQAKAAKAKPTNGASNGHGNGLGEVHTAPVGEPIGLATVAPSAQALAEALGSYLDTLIGARIDHQLEQRLARLTEKR